MDIHKNTVSVDALDLHFAEKQKRKEMETIIELYISKQSPERQGILTKLHDAIVEADKSVKAMVEPMMGKEMIVYKCNGFMKYGLSSMKNYMSLHVMPIYASTTLYARYKALLPRANFQKGCINFKNDDEMPLDIFQKLMMDCSRIDLEKVRNNYLKSKNRKTND